MKQVLAVVGRGVVEWDETIACADDLGLTRGDGCFEATLVTTKPELKVHNFTEHMERLARSGAAMEFVVPSVDAWQETLAAALAVWSSERGICKIVMNRGREFAPGEPMAFLTLTDLSSNIRMAESGIRVSCLSRGYTSDAFADAPWLLGGVKTTSYAVNMASKREAARRGADDVLFISSDGYALEGPTSGLVWLKDGKLGTVPAGATGILDSITVAQVLEGAAAAGYECHRSLISLEDLKQVDAAWLMSSARGVAPITALDDTELAVHHELSEQLRIWADIV